VRADAVGIPRARRPHGWREMTNKWAVIVNFPKTFEVISHGRAARQKPFLFVETQEKRAANAYAEGWRMKGAGFTARIVPIRASSRARAHVRRVAR